ncbi:hypothetical protein [Corynebacterium timonense]|uniref:Asp23 family, cell envelope-related function n=1 Tax=Corynebacterium timonense TaxID=441500 RepID=A0A1H1STJ0_9CORY|nr:hypothetical protein [Corynebacterium timonense]SDS51284.1 hypothetical protein SAMN04488539_1820 [Corynebacterium timonense]
MPAPAVTIEEASAAREAALAVAGVAGLDRGRFGEVCLLFPGGRVEGLRLARGSLEVHVVVDVAAARSLYDVADDVRSAVLSVTRLDSVDVIVTDALSRHLHTPIQGK